MFDIFACFHFLIFFCFSAGHQRHTNGTTARSSISKSSSCSKTRHLTRTASLAHHARHDHGTRFPVCKVTLSQPPIKRDVPSARQRELAAENVQERRELVAVSSASTQRLIHGATCADEVAHDLHIFTPQIAHMDHAHLLSAR